MPHYLILGMTESGKSRLGITLCREFRRRRILTAVLDPMFDDRWQADIIFRNLESFDRFAWSHTGAFLFVDELAGFGKYNAALQKLVCKGRHLGHNVYLITQFGTQVSPIVRAQCSKAFIFASSMPVLKMIAEEWNKPDLLTRPPLPPGHFFKVSRFSKTSERFIDFRTGAVYKNTSALRQHM